MRTILIVLTALVVLVGCGGSTGGSYKPKDTAIGETADRVDFEFRVLDVVRDESCRYPETEDPDASSAQSYAVEFAVVWYAVRNTGDAPLNLGKLGDTSAGVLTADTGESFSVSGDPRAPDNVSPAFATII